MPKKTGSWKFSRLVAGRRSSAASRSWRTSFICKAVAEAFEPRLLLSSYEFSTASSLVPTQGAKPYSTPVLSSTGNLFGTATIGGVANEGTVYELPAGSSTISTVASFTGANGSDPYGGLAIDSSGNLFGTTATGGAYGDGTVFEIAGGSGVITTLASFNGVNGSTPHGSVTLDANGNLFGTTTAGGTSGDGTIFEVARGTGAITTIASFAGANGVDPESGATLDSHGNLFGTTLSNTLQFGSTGYGTIYEVASGSAQITTLFTFTPIGGDNPYGNISIDSNADLFSTTESGGANGYGNVFEMQSGSSTITALWSFSVPLGTTTYSDGFFPYAGVALDSNGDLFGTTESGGIGTNQYYGTVYEIPAGTRTRTILASFTNNGVSGIYPYAGVVLDASGDVFGCDSAGGQGNGTIYEIPRGASTFTTLAPFAWGNGDGPYAGLTSDSKGNLFGTASFGGSNYEGTVFELPHGSNLMTNIATFTGSNGAYPQSNLLFDSSGNLYGTTYGGGSGSGTVFEIARGSSTITTLASFSGITGNGPRGTIGMDSSGNIYGTTYLGGINNDGTVFEFIRSSRLLTPLAFFNGTNGVESLSGAVVDSSGNVFGEISTSQSGQSDIVFEIAKGTVTMTTLVNFGTANGPPLKSNMAVDGKGDVFGTTIQGGTNGHGIIFEFAAGSATLTTLANCTSTAGAGPTNLSLDPAGNIFGISLSGPFELPNGSTTVVQLTNFVNFHTVGPLAIDPYGDLFGTTLDGGLSGAGSIFEVSAAQLKIVQSPSPAQAGVPISPAVTVAIDDAAGVLLTGDTSSITLTLSSGTFAGGSSSVTAPVVNGIATFSNLTINTGGTYSLTASDGGLPTTASASFTIAPDPPPKVTAVAFSSSQWSSSFPEAGGYAIPTGAAQSTDLPWINLDTISIAFNKTVNVTQNSLAVAGVNQVTYTAGGFSYNASTDTATWTFAAPFGADKLLLSVASSGVNAVADSLGTALDGEWANGASAFPSGNGTAGGDFNFNVSILPGDVDGNGSVSIVDTVATRNRQFNAVGSANYAVNFDVDGSGSISIVDTIDVRNRQFTSLPGGSPSLPATVLSGQQQTRAVAPTKAAVKLPETSGGKNPTAVAKVPPTPPSTRSTGNVTKTVLELLDDKRKKITPSPLNRHG
ncbi:MAG TPA: choice-of-anchor tandem repeat GloVer-containing protein [Tepidisphaeraceae bacterium]|jgi:uncharacterized repeat protein (TIGR03803 family)|nr:choice-of-anchor tandem repeat GloVer-containing protein [Tepidisphaeraceae bacterium]